MTTNSILQIATSDAYPVLVAGLEAQVGREGSAGIATSFLAAERADFHWQSRMSERHLGRFGGVIDEDDEGLELERIAIFGVLKGAWFVAICIVDGDGAVHDIFDLKPLQSAEQAHDAFESLC